MTLTQQDFDEDMIREFGDEFTEACELIEQTLDQLADDPENQDLVNELFRHVHTVKGNLRMVEFNDIAAFVHAIEDIIDAIRNQQLHYDLLLKDVTLLAMEKVQDMFNAAFAGESLDDFDSQAVQDILEQIPLQQGGYRHLVIDACRLLDPGYEPPADAASTSGGETPQAEETGLSETAPDLVAFHQMAIRFEDRMPGWEQRTEYLLEICQSMNEIAGEPVERSQLAAAVCLHDIAMDTETPPLDDDIWPMPGAAHRHIALALRLIGQYAGWETAARIIAQHHERYDGSGFPQGLKRDEIEPGARLLAVAGRFVDLSMDRADFGKAGIMQTLKTMRGEFGRRLDPAWLEPLIQTIRQRYC